VFRIESLGDIMFNGVALDDL